MLTDIPPSEALELIRRGEDLLGLRVAGPLKIRGLDVATLPRGLHVWGPLTIAECNALEALPRDLRATGDIRILRCPNLRDLPENLTAPLVLMIQDCPKLTHFPAGLSVDNLALEQPHEMAF